MAVESRKQGVESSKIAISFNSSFFTHYTQVLSAFVNRYNEQPHDDENIGRFQYESHNFGCLLEKVQFIHQWPITSIVNLTHALTCNLILETFTIGELMKLAQSTLMVFEYKMDGIAAQVGASETLKVYRDLILTFRRWLHSSAVDCSTSCEETFPLEGFANRFHAIDKQLTMTNHSIHDYYSELKFPYYNPFNISVCFSFCKMPSRISSPVFALAMIPVFIFSFVILKMIFSFTISTVVVTMLSLPELLMLSTLIKQIILILVMMLPTLIIVILGATVIMLTTLALVPTLKMVRTMTMVTILIMVTTLMTSEMSITEAPTTEELILMYIVLSPALIARLQNRASTNVLLLVSSSFCLPFLLIFVSNFYFLFPIWYPLLYVISVLNHHHIIAKAIYCVVWHSCIHYLLRYNCS